MQPSEERTDRIAELKLNPDLPDIPPGAPKRLVIRKVHWIRGSADIHGIDKQLAGVAGQRAGVLQEANALTAVRRLRSRNGEPAAGDVENVVEANENVCTEEPDARHPDELREGRGGKAKVIRGGAEVLAGEGEAARRAEAGRRACVKQPSLGAWFNKEVPISKLKR